MATRIERATATVSFEGTKAAYQVGDLINRALHVILDQAVAANSQGIQWDTLEFTNVRPSYGDPYVELSVLYLKEV